MEDDGQCWKEWMGMDCPGTCLGSKVTKSTARLYCREYLAKRRDGGKKLTSSGWILSHFQIKIYRRLGAMSWTESNDPADPSQLCTLFYITPEFSFPALPGAACRGCA